MSNDTLKCLQVTFPGARAPRGAVSCKIGEDLLLRVRELELFCFKELSVSDEELVLLAGAIAFADRRFKRSIVSWHRSIHIVMPVAEPTHWNRPVLVQGLSNALKFLTGDTWSFEFVLRRQGRLPTVRNPELNLNGVGEFVVIPFSNGLDSFAQSRLLQKDGFRGTPIRVTAWNRGLGGSRDWITDPHSLSGRHRRVAVPVRIKAAPGAEQSYRTRTFVFSVLAGLAAHLSGAKSIVVPEAGQGSFGPSLVTLGYESPHRGSHPGFSRRMESFFRAFWGDEISFIHPQLWRTKGQVLQVLRQDQLDSGIERTRSCSRGPRDLRSGLECGVCSGCLLRRLATFSADVGESDDRFLWSNLRASSIEESLRSDSSRAVSINDRDIAVHAVLAMESLARQAELSPVSTSHQESLFDAFGHQPEKFKESGPKLAQLLKDHQREWRAFTAELGSSSWVNQQIAVLP